MRIDALTLFGIAFESTTWLRLWLRTLRVSDPATATTTCRLSIQPPGVFEGRCKDRRSALPAFGSNRSSLANLAHDHITLPGACCPPLHVVLHFQFLSDKRGSLNHAACDPGGGILFQLGLREKPARTGIQNALQVSGYLLGEDIPPGLVRQDVAAPISSASWIALTLSHWFVDVPFAVDEV